MAVNALRDLNLLPESEKKTECFTNGDFHKPCTEHNNGNFEEQRKTAAPFVKISTNVNETGSSETEAANSEVEYIESENLDDVEDVDTSLETLIGSLESKDWVVVCGALNNVRRFSMFHKDLLCDTLAIITGDLLVIENDLGQPIIRQPTRKDQPIPYSDRPLWVQSNPIDPAHLPILCYGGPDRENGPEVAMAWAASLTLPGWAPSPKTNGLIRYKASLLMAFLIQIGPPAWPPL